MVKMAKTKMDKDVKNVHEKKVGRWKNIGICHKGYSS